MDKNKLWDKLQALEEKVDSLLEYEQANKRCEANEVKTEIEFKPKMKRLDLEAKLYCVIKKLELKITIFLAVPLAMLGFAIALTLMQLTS